MSQASGDRLWARRDAKSGTRGIEASGHTHLVGHLRLVGVEELATTEELVDHEELFRILDARVEVEGGVLGEGLVGDDIDGTHLARLCSCERWWGLCDYVVDGCKKVSLRDA